MIKWTILAVILSVSGHAEIHEVITITEANHWLKEADENTLIVFDVDYTLIMPGNPASHRPNSWKYRDWLFELQDELTQDDWGVYSGIFMFSDLPLLVEPEISIRSIGYG